MAVDDSYTKLLLHLESKYGLLYPDEAGKYVTGSGAVSIQATQKKIGSKALAIDSGGYLSVPNSADIQLGSSDFCWEGWLYASSLADYNILFSIRSGHMNNEEINLRTLGTELQCWYTSNGEDQVRWGTQGLGFTTGAWHHVALVRNGSEMYIFYDGIKKATYSIGSTSLYASTAPMIIGYGNGMDDFAYWRGYIDEVRLSKGAPRYTVDFTPATSMFGTEGPYDFIDENTYLLIHANTPTITDVMTAPLTIGGNAALSQTQKKFGDSSISFDGGEDYIYTPNTGSKYSLGSGLFTMDAWVYMNAMPTSDGWPSSWSSHMVVMGLGSPSAEDGCILVMGQTKLILASNDSQIISGVHGITTGAWHHVAVTRDGNTFRLFVDGVKIAEATSSATMGGGSGFYIGCEAAQGAWFNGYIDEVRLSIGVARWTADFTPPTAEYGAATPTTSRRFAQFI